jgi:hypothetical protein
MLQRAATAVLALAGLAACTDPIVLKDLWGPDASVSPDSAAVSQTDAPPPLSCDHPLQYNPLEYKPRPAPFIILLDRSKGMQYGLPGGPPYSTRESASQAVLTGAVSTYQASIALGLESFPQDPSDPSCDPNSCCVGEVAVLPYPNNAKAMLSGINCTPIGGGAPPTGFCPSYIEDSPWHLALGEVRDGIKKAKYGYSSGTQRYLLLITTASEPTCFTDARASDACEFAKSVVNELGNSLDTRLYVISVGYMPPDQGSCLSRIGQTSSFVPLLPGTQQSVYVATDFNELNNAVGQIFLAIAQQSCTVTTSQVAPSGVTIEVLDAKNQRIEQGDRTIENGWYFSGPKTTSITFTGRACTDYLNALLSSAGNPKASPAPAFFGYYTCPDKSGSDQGLPQP